MSKLVSISSSFSDTRPTTILSCCSQLSIGIFLVLPAAVIAIVPHEVRSKSATVQSAATGFWPRSPREHWFSPSIRSNDGLNWIWKGILPVWRRTWRGQWSVADIELAVQRSSVRDDHWHWRQRCSRAEIIRRGDGGEGRITETCCGPDAVIHRSVALWEDGLGGMSSPFQGFRQSECRHYDGSWCARHGIKQWSRECLACIGKGLHGRRWGRVYQIRAVIDMIRVPMWHPFSARRNCWYTDRNAVCFYSGGRVWNENRFKSPKFQVPVSFELSAASGVGCMFLYYWLMHVNS